MKNKTLTPFYLCLGLIKHQMWYKNVIGWFQFSLRLFFIVFILRNGCKKENVGFSKEMLSKFCQNPCSCFSYRLSYNHPNELILIGKEP